MDTLGVKERDVISGNKQYTKHRSTSRIVHQASDQPVEQESIKDFRRTFRSFLVARRFIKKFCGPA
jgi:hypothetical protein